MPLTDDDIIQAILASAREHNQIGGLLGTPSQPIGAHFVQLVLTPPDKKPSIEQLSIEENHHDAPSLALDDLFTLDREPAFTSCRQLLWGRAGSGKSILCQYISWCFAQELPLYPQWKKHIHVILPIRLKHLTLPDYEKYFQANSLYAAIASVFYLEILNLTQRQALIRKVGNEKQAMEESIHLIQAWLINKNPHILLLLDGLDEVIGHLTQKTPLAKALRTLYQHPSILLTSRPLAEIQQTFEQKQQALGGPFQRALENKGFNLYSIRRYIHRCFEQEKPAVGLEIALSRNEASPIDLGPGQPLFNYLTSSATLLELAKIPLLLRLFCYLWQSSTLENKVNQHWLEGYTPLYQQLTAAFLRYHYETEQPGYFNHQPDNKINDTLVAHYAASMRFLYALTYHSFIGASNAVLIEPNVLKKLLDTPCYQSIDFVRNIQPLGFLAPVEKKDGERNNPLDLSYEYLHLTFKDYFTALHIAQGLATLETGADALKAIQSELIAHRYHARWEWVWRFLAGLIHTEHGLGALLPQEREQAQRRFWSIIWGKPYEEIGFAHLRLLAVVLEETQGPHPFAEVWEERWVDALLNPAHSAIQPSLYLQHLSTELTLYPRLHEKLTWRYVGYSPQRRPKTWAGKKNLVQKCHTFLAAPTVIKQCLSLADWQALLKDDDASVRYQTLLLLGRIPCPELALIILLMTTFQTELEAQNQMQALKTILTWLKPELPQGTLETLETKLVALDNAEAEGHIIDLSCKAPRSQLSAELRHAFHQAWPAHPATDDFLARIETVWLNQCHYQANLTRMTLQSEHPDLSKLLPAFYTALESDEPLLRDAAWQTLEPYAFLLPEPQRQSLHALLQHEHHLTVKKRGQAVLAHETSDLPHAPAPLPLEEDSFEATLLLLIKELIAFMSLENGAFSPAITTSLISLAPHCNNASLQLWLDSLVRRLADKDRGIRNTATHILAALAPHLNDAGREQVLGTLLPRLADEDWGILRPTAIDGLAVLIPHLNDVGRKQVLSVLLPWLVDEDWGIRHTAIRVLAALAPHLNDAGCEQALRALLPRLSDKNERVRNAAIGVLATLASHLNDAGCEQVLRALLPRLVDEEKSVCNAAADALTTLADTRFEKLLNTLLPRLADKIGIARVAATQSLAILASRLSDSRLEPVLSVLLPRLIDVYEGVRIAAAQVLAVLAPRLNDAGLVLILNTLLPRLAVNDWSLRNNTLQALIILAPQFNDAKIQQLLGVLLPRLTDKNWSVCNTTLQALATLAPRLNNAQCEQVQGALQPLLTDKNEDVRAPATQVLTALTLYLNDAQCKQVLSVLLPPLANWWGGARVVAILALAALVPYLNDTQQEQVLGVLLPQFANEDLPVRNAATWTLIALAPSLNDAGRAQVLGVLLPRLVDEDCQVRLPAIRVLALLAPHLNDAGWKQVLGALLPRLVDKGGRVRITAKGTLVAIAPHLNDAKLNQLLSALLPQLVDEDWQVRYAAKDTLAAIAPHLNDAKLNQLLATLLPQLVDEGRQVRYAAKETVVSIAPHLSPPLLQTLISTLLIYLRHENVMIHESILNVLYTIKTPSLRQSFAHQALNQRLVEGLLTAMLQQPELSAMQTQKALHYLTAQNALDPWIAAALSVYVHHHQQQQKTLLQAFQDAQDSPLTTDDARLPQPLVTLSRALVKQCIPLLQPTPHERLSRWALPADDRELLCLTPETELYQSCSGLFRSRLLLGLAERLTQPTARPRDSLPRFSTARLTLPTAAKTYPLSMHYLVHAPFPQKQEKKDNPFTLHFLPSQHAVRITLHFPLQLRCLSMPSATFSSARNTYLNEPVLVKISDKKDVFYLAGPLEEKHLKYVQIKKLDSLQILQQLNFASNALEITLSIQENQPVYDEIVATRLGRSLIYREAQQLTALDQALSQCPFETRYLDLSHNALTDNAIAILQDYLDRFYQLRGLALESNHLTFEGCRLLLQQVHHTRLRKLSLAYNHIQVNISDFKALLLPIIKEHLDFLNLSGNEIHAGYVYHYEGYPCVLNEANAREHFLQEPNIAPLIPDEKDKQWESQQYFCQHALAHESTLFSHIHAPVPSLFSRAPFHISDKAAQPLTLDVNGQPENSIVALIKTSSGITQHVFLILESLTAFGQRELMRAELTVEPGGHVRIRCCYTSTPKIRAIAERAPLIRLARLTENQKKNLLATIFNNQNNQDFIHYNPLAHHLEHSGSRNCILWAMNQLQTIGIIQEQEKNDWQRDFFKRQSMIAQVYEKNSNTCCMM
ncbi:MAG: HEAT repeat domain-containing protein [Gammaproteobacteria bacterium]|nr:HEAT repeat domain-containing protein [Gammaproteobacteria bacterium]